MAKVIRINKCPSCGKPHHIISKSKAQVKDSVYVIGARTSSYVTGGDNLIRDISSVGDENTKHAKAHPKNKKQLLKCPITNQLIEIKVPFSNEDVEYLIASEAEHNK